MKRFKTSREIYDQIRWDPRFQPAEVWIAYETRDAGDSEIPFEAFDPNGDIPWHRVQFFRTEAEVIWDRRSRVDRSLEIAARGPRRAVPTAAPKEAPRPPKERERLPAVTRQAFAFDVVAGAWLPVEEAPSAPTLHEVSFLTYNLLGDARDAEASERATRIPVLRELIASAGADVVGVQELSQAVWRGLLEGVAPLGYYAARPPEDPTLDPQGVGLLSRLPIARVVEHPYSRHKRALLAELRTQGGPLVAVVVHFTSDLQPEASATRAAQWKWLQEEVLAADPAVLAGARVVLLGDFNAEPEEAAAWSPSFAGVEAWGALRPEDPGYTFDTIQNGLAARVAPRARRARLDYVWLSDGLAPSGVEHFAAEPLDAYGSCASDHFGVLARARWSPVARTHAASSRAWEAEELSYKAALTIVPPRELWGPIQAIRRQHDPSFSRWMPHLNLFFGFYPERCFAALLPELRALLAEEGPIPLRLSRVKWFQHKSNLTLWLGPDDDGIERLRALYAKLAARFPKCDAEQAGANQFNPHLKLAQVPRAEAERAAHQAAQWQKELPPLTFTVEGVHLLSRRGDEPFASRQFVPLGPPPLPSAAHHEARALIESACAAALGEPRPQLYTTGSNLLGAAGPESDLDLSCIGPPGAARGEFFENLRLLLMDEPRVTQLRLVSSAVVPVLKAEVRGIPVDVSFAARPASAPPSMEDWTAEDFAAVSPEEQRAAASYPETLGILDCARRHFCEGEFRHLLAAVTRWAKARQVHGNRYGYWGGFSWALLVASYLTAREATRSPLDALQGFFARYAAWPWPSPVVLPGTTPPHEARPPSAMPILGPLPPYRESGRGLVAPTARALRAELQRAATLLADTSRSEAARWVALEKPSAPDEGVPRVRLVLQVRAPEEQAGARGWVEARLPWLAASLDELAGPARLFLPQVRGDEWSCVVSLGASLREGSERWLSPVQRELSAIYPSARLSGE